MSATAPSELPAPAHEVETLPRLARAFGSIGFVLFLGKAAFALKDVFVAFRFGSGDVLDAFIAASIVPIFLTQTLALVLGDAFLPVFTSLREKNRDPESRKLLSSLLFAGSVVAICLALIAIPLRPQILQWLAGGYTGEKRALASTLLLWLLPFVFAPVWTALLGSTLVALGQGQKVAATQILTPIFTMSLLALIATPDPRVLAMGMVGGTVVEAVVLLRLLSVAGIRPQLRWSGATPELRQTFTQFIPLFFGQMLSMGSVLVDQAMSTGLGDGAVSALSFGTKVTLAASNVASVSLTMVVFPRFAQLSAQGEWKALWRTFRLWGAAVFIVAAAGAGLLIMLSEPITRMLFERGAFTPADTLQASRIQQVFALQIPFVLFGIMEVRLLTSMSRNHLITATAAVNFGVNIVGNYFLRQYLGVIGIALSTTCVMIVSCLVLTFFVRRTLRQLQT